MHPVLFHLGPLALPTFGALLAAGLLAGLALSGHTARLAGIAPEALWDAGLFAVAAAFVVSRGLLAAAYWPTFLRHPLLLLAQPSLTATGVVLTLLLTLAWLAWKRVPPLLALEAWTPSGLLVWGFLALGHFAEGSDPGMPTQAAWGVRFPGSTFAQQPVTLILVFGALLLAAASFLLLRRGRPAAGPGLVGAGLLQVLTSFLRQPGAPSFAGLDAMEWVGLALFASGGLMLALRDPAAIRRTAAD